jgi:O-antigen/teichoic acid export membrane protein
VGENEGGGSRPVAERLIRLLFAAGAGAAAVLAVIPEPILDLFFGERYVESAAALRILAFAVPLVFVNAVFLYELVAAGHQGACAKAQAVTTTANVVLNVLLIPRIGFRGAAVATVLSEGLTTLLFARLNRVEMGRRTERPVWADTRVLGGGAAALLLAGVLRVLWPVSPVLAAGAALLCWTGAVLGLRVVGAAEIALILPVGRRPEAP